VVAALIHKIGLLTHRNSSQRPIPPPHGGAGLNPAPSKQVRSDFHGYNVPAVRDRPDAVTDGVAADGHGPKKDNYSTSAVPAYYGPRILPAREWPSFPASNCSGLDTVARSVHYVPLALDHVRFKIRTSLAGRWLVGLKSESIEIFQPGPLLLSPPFLLRPISGSTSGVTTVPGTLQQWDEWTVTVPCAETLSDI